MRLEGIPRAVVTVVVSWFVSLFSWAGLLVGAATFAPRGATNAVAGGVGVVMALVLAVGGWVVATRAIGRHVPDGPGKTVLLAFAIGMVLFMALIEVLVTVVAIAR